MNLDPTLVAPSAPKLTSRFDSDAERLGPLNRSLSDLEMASRQFSADGALADYCKQNLDWSNVQGSLWRDWIFLAHRDAAMAARNFEIALESVTLHALKVEAWTKLIVRDAFKAPRRRFKAAFPNSIDIRNAVAHPEEYAKPNPHTPMSPRGVRTGLGAVAGGVVGVTLESNIIGGTIGSSFKGRYAICDLTLESARELVAIARLTFGVFDAVPHHSVEKLFP